MRTSRGRKKYSAVNSERSFHQKIEEDPHELTHALVYADWLDDHDRPGLAEMVRKQANATSHRQETSNKLHEEAYQRQLAHAHEVAGELGGEVERTTPPVITPIQMIPRFSDEHPHSMIGYAHHAGGRVLVEVHQPSLHNPQLTFRYSHWLDNPDQARETVDHLRSEGFPLVGIDTPENQHTQEGRYARMLYPSSPKTTTGGEVTPMSRISRSKKYAEPPETPPGRPARSVGTLTNPGYLSGTRLESVLHEIRNNYGAEDPQLKVLADRAIRGDFGSKGEVFTAIRDRVARHGIQGSGRAYKQRARDIATEYNWHRVHDKIKLDSAVYDAVRRMTAKGKLANSGASLRAAHNLFGMGSDVSPRMPMKVRGAASDKRQAFLETLRSHTGRTDVSDEELLKSVRRLAEREENHERYKGAIHIDPQATANSYEGQFDKPAGTVTPKGVHRAYPGANAGQYERKPDYRMRPRRYGLFSTGPKNQGPVVNGVVHTSHPNGVYNEDSHMMANIERAGVHHALTTLGLLPERDLSEPRNVYDKRMRNLADAYTKEAGEFVKNNPRHEDTLRYLKRARHLTPASADTPVFNPGVSRTVKRHDIEPLGMSPVNLAYAVSPILKNIAQNKGRLETPPEEEIHEPQAPGLIDLSDPEHHEEEKGDLLAPADREEEAAGILSHEPPPPFGHEKPKYEVVGGEASPEDFDLPELPTAGLPPMRPLRDKDNPEMLGGIRQTIANHLEGQFGHGIGRMTPEMKAGVIQALQDNHNLHPSEAERHLSNYLRMKGKPAPEAPPKTSRAYPPIKRLSRKYNAWRASTDTIANGVTYKGGEFMPDMQGPFMNPPKLQFDPKKLDRIRKRTKKHTTMIRTDDGSGGTIPAHVHTKRLSRLAAKSI